MTITVVTPAGSKDLTILATVKTELVISASTDDAFINTLIQQASAAIVTYCNREFASETVDETVKAYGGANLMLSRTPVTTLTSVTLDDGITSTVIPTADYMLEDSQAGFIRSLVGGWSCTNSQVYGILGRPVAGSEFQAYKVRYVGGYTLLTDLPHDIERAAIDLVKSKYLGRGKDSNITEETVPQVYSVKYGTSDFSNPIKELLGPYRRII